MGKPSFRVLKDNQKAIHPRSRKAKQITKKLSRELKLKKRKGDSNLKLQCLGDKLAWFKDNMDTEQDVITPQAILTLIQRYIDRNAEELKQINMKHSIGGRLARQHASREDCIRITHERESDQFLKSGFETVDLLSSESVKIFKSWKGELRFLPNLKLRKYTKQSLEAMMSGAQEPEDPPGTHQMEEDSVSSEEEDDNSAEEMAQ